MSLVTSRIALQHRCTIQRNEGAADDWGSQAEDWQPVAEDVPCRAFTLTGSEPADQDRTAAFVERRITLPLSTDVTEQDRILSVTSRGSEVFDGPMSIEAVLIYQDHLELIVQRIR